MNPQLQMPQRPQGIFSGPPYAPLPHSYKPFFKGLAIVLLVVAVLVAAGVAYWYFLSPAAWARRASDDYMNSLSTNNVDYAAYLSSDTADWSLLESASQSVRGESKLVSKTEKSGTFFFLYTLTNPTNKTARISVVKTSKGYRVTTFVFSPGSLALLPGSLATVPGGVASIPADMTSEMAVSPSGASGSSTSSGTPAASPGSSSAGTTSSSGTPSSSGKVSGSTSGSSSGASPGGVTVASACLLQSDYSSVFDDAASAGTTWSAGTPYSASVGFTTGSLDYLDNFETGDLYAVWLKFYNAYPTKNYLIHIAGALVGGDASLANQRAQKAQSALMSVGVPASKIVVDSPSTVTDPSDADFATLSIIPGC